MEPPVERLHENLSRLFGFGDKLRGLVGVGGERLFQENVFARLERFVGPLKV